jgi:hypothetical protein
MKIYHLIWIVTEGFCQYFQDEWRAIENQELADAFGVSFEYEENTGKKPDHELTKEEREIGSDIGIKNRSKCLKFLDASEIDIIESANDELFDVSFKLKCRRKIEGNHENRCYMNFKRLLKKFSHNKTIKD